MTCLCLWQIRNKELEIEVMNLKDDNQQVEVRNEQRLLCPFFASPT